MSVPNLPAGESPTIRAVRVVPVAGHDSMLLNLSGAHGPFFTRNLVIVTDSANRTGVGERPAAVGIERDARVGKPLVQRGDRLDFGLAGEDATLQLEVGEAVARLRRFGEAHHRSAVKRRRIAQLEPRVAARTRR